MQEPSVFPEHIEANALEDHSKEDRKREEDQKHQAGHDHLQVQLAQEGGQQEGKGRAG